MPHDFKVGDEVECVSNEYRSYLDGKIGRVVGTYHSGGGTLLDVRFPETSQGYKKDIWVLHAASLIPAKPPKPIRDYL